MIKSIVVMGGSFNPPTIAHHKLMKAAMDQLGADKGIYVPTPARSLRRKMRKAGFPEEGFSEETRRAGIRWKPCATSGKNTPERKFSVLWGLINWRYLQMLTG